MRSASSTGTVLAVSVLSVRAKRAVLLPRTTLPTSGRRSRNWCQRRRFDSTRSQRVNRKTAPARPMTSQTPYSRMKSLPAISICVSSGSSASLVRNTSTTFGTTDTSRKNTIATQTTNSSTG